MGLLISTNWKSNNYDSLLIIIDCLIKIIYYELIKITINTHDLIEIIIDMIIQYHSLFDLIVSDWGMVFISKFWSSFYYFLKIN